MRPGQGRDFRIDVLRFNGEIRGLGEQIADVAQKRLVGSGVQRAPLAPGVPGIDGVLKLIAPGKQGSVDRPEFIECRFETGPERIEADTGARQHVFPHQPVKLLRDLKTAALHPVRHASLPKKRVSIPATPAQKARKFNGLVTNAYQSPFVIARGHGRSDMDIAFGKEDEAFRDEVRDFLDEKLTPSMREAAARLQVSLDHLKAIAQTETRNGTPLWEIPAFRARVSTLEIRTQALLLAEHQTLARLSRGESPGPDRRWPRTSPSRSTRASTS